MFHSEQSLPASGHRTECESTKNICIFSASVTENGDLLSNDCNDGQSMVGKESTRGAELTIIQDVCSPYEQHASQARGRLTRESIQTCSSCINDRVRHEGFDDFLRSLALILNAW